MAYDIDYRRENGGSLLTVGGGPNGPGTGGGGGFGFQGGGSATFPGMPDMSDFYRQMAERQAEKENYRRQQEQDAIARQREEQLYERGQSANALDRQRQDRMEAHNEQNRMRSQMLIDQQRQQGDPGVNLEGLAPTVENRMGAQGQRYDYVDPRAAAIANAKAGKAGFGGNAFIGGRIGSNLASSFSHDDLSAPLEWMGGATHTDKDSDNSAAQDEIDRRGRAAKYGYGG